MAKKVEKKSGKKGKGCGGKKLLSIAVILAMVLGAVLVTMPTASAASPTVTANDITTADGSYKAGQNIDITITYSENVFVTGTPTLALNTAPARTATYNSGTGTTNLVFRYTVVAGDTAADLGALDVNAISLNGGTIKNAAAETAVNTLLDDMVAANAVIIDTTAPTLTITTNPTSPSKTKTSLVYTFTFSEPVTGFAVGDITLNFKGAGPRSVDATSIFGTTSTSVYTLTFGAVDLTALGGLASGQTVVASVYMPGLTDVALNPGVGATTNTWTYDGTPPTLTITTAPTSPSKTKTSLVYTFTFSEPVIGFDAAGIKLAFGVEAPPGGGVDGSIFATTSTSVYTLTLAGQDKTDLGALTTGQTVVATVIMSGLTDIATNPGGADVTNTWTYDITAPTVTINKKATQADPTNTAPILFTVVFSESVSDFTASDVTISGTAGATTAAISGSGANYEVSVTGMTASGTVTATIAAGVAHDAAGNANTASTSTDNTVTYDTALDTTPPTVTINKKAGQADPANAGPILFTVVFSESVADFATGDVTLTGTAGATTAAVSGSGTTYEVSVTGMTASGTVIADIAAGAAHDAAGNANTVSTSTDHEVVYDVTAPTAAITYSPTGTVKGGVSLTITVTFSEAMKDSPAPKIAITGVNTLAATAMTRTDATHYTYTYMVGAGNGTATVALSVGTDLAGNVITSTPASGATFTVEKKETKPTPGFGLTEIVAAGAVALVAIAAVKNKGKKPKK